MSLIAETALESLRRWRSMNENKPDPPIRVFLTNGDEISLTGLAIAPSEKQDVVTLHARGSDLPMFVLRDEDIRRIEIGIAEPVPFQLYGARRGV